MRPEQEQRSTSHRLARRAASMRGAVTLPGIGSWPLWLPRFAAWALGFVFLAAALPKLADPPGFAQALHGFDLLPEKLLAPLALTLPWLELWMSLALLAGVARRSAALLALSLLLTFSGALGWNLIQGHAVDCGCFGSGASKSTEERFRDMKLGLSRNLILGLLAMYCLVRKRESQGEVK